MIADWLSKKIAALAPIHGVSIGRRGDPSTWRIDFSEEATEQQRNAATAALKTFSPLDGMKAIKNEGINASRLAANRSTFPFGGKQIACDELSRSDIDGVAAFVALYDALPPEFPGAWKAVDNNYVPIPDAATFKAMISAMVAAGTSNFLHAQDLKAQLAAATTEEEIQAIAW